MNLNHNFLPIFLSLTSLVLPIHSAHANKPIVKDIPSLFAIPQTPIETLKSDRLLDYEPLQTLLRSGKWNEAAGITSTQMLKASGQLEQGMLTEVNTRAFPCNDLLTIDKLWRYYSGDRFGLSIQSNIWVSIGGKNEKDARRFAQQVGWRKPIGPVRDDRIQVPSGYFPLRPAGNGGVTEAWGGKWIAEMPKRLIVCQSPLYPVVKPTVKPKPLKKIKPKA